MPPTGLTPPGLAVAQDRVQPHRPRAGVNPRATATKPWRANAPAGHFLSMPVNHAQHPQGGFVPVARG
jgi:hypothetical protein